MDSCLAFSMSHSGFLPSLTRTSLCTTFKTPFSTQSDNLHPVAAIVATARGTTSLHNGTWFKLICGASTHDVPMVQNLSEVYTLAGVDCIDIAADFAIIQAAKEGIRRATNQGANNPLLMVSVNDDGDIHFRKAYFDPSKCPTDCPRPCEKVCPADAISEIGVLEPRCYGCGRCIPVCPLGLVHAEPVNFDLESIREILRNVDAVEIHTGKGRENSFQTFFQSIQDLIPNLKVLAISFPNLGDDSELKRVISIMWQTVKSSVVSGDVELIWQVDGKPMSGDIGAGTAKAAVQLAKRVRQILTTCGFQGHVQLAGGTNWKTVPLMNEAGILREEKSTELNSAAGLAVGGYARKIVKEALGEEGGTGESMSEKSRARAIEVASLLVDSIKRQYR